LQSIGTLCRELCKQRTADTMIEMHFELLESREHVLHEDVDVSTGRGTVGGVWPIEKHSEI